MILEDGVCQKLDGLIALQIRPLVDEELDGALLHKGYVGVGDVEAHDLDLSGKPGVIHRMGGTAQTGAADEIPVSSGSSASLSRVSR